MCQRELQSMSPRGKIWPPGAGSQVGKFKEDLCWSWTYSRNTNERKNANWLGSRAAIRPNTTKAPSDQGTGTTQPNMIMRTLLRRTRVVKSSYQIGTIIYDMSIVGKSGATLPGS